MEHFEIYMTCEPDSVRMKYRKKYQELLDKPLPFANRQGHILPETIYRRLDYTYFRLEEENNIDKEKLAKDCILDVMGEVKAYLVERIR